MSLTGIYKRKDGRWEARLRVDNKENGKLIIKSFYGKTAIDVQKRCIHINDLFCMMKKQKNRFSIFVMNGWK